MSPTDFKLAFSRITLAPFRMELTDGVEQEDQLVCHYSNPGKKSDWIRVVAVKIVRNSWIRGVF